MENIAIRQILEQVLRGQIRIPAFQRGFVWDSDRVAYLMDSIYKQYPFGSLLFWRTKEKLKHDRDLGPFKLPEPKEDYPVDYVLDGQQRITSIFGVFQNSITLAEPAAWTKIYFDLSAEPTAQDSQFVALQDHEVDPTKHFPLDTLFESTAYREATEAFGKDDVKRIDEMQSVFKEVQIPVQTSKTDDKATVAIIFERVNRQGMELDTIQLLSAWTWSEDFQLQDQFAELAEDLRPFGFGELGGDTNLLLRCCSAVLNGDASPQALMQMNGGAVREKFDCVMNGVKYAVDYMRKHYLAETLSNLPFTTLLVPLSVFFAVPGNKEASYSDYQRQKIDRWFWRASFSRRYSSGVLRNLKSDIEQMVQLRDKGDSDLGEFATSVDEAFFTDNLFSMSSVNTKTFILMLASAGPRSFVSGAPVDLKVTLKSSNRTEYHHLMPRAFLRESGQNTIHESALVNFCFLSRADNRILGGDAPSTYRAKMGKNINEILTSAMCSETLFANDFVAFAHERAALLVEKARSLCGIKIITSDTAIPI